MSYDHTPHSPDDDPPRGASHLRLFISLMILAVLAFVFILYFTGLVQIYYVESGSMEPTLQIGDRILVDGAGAYDRFDIVAFRHPKTDEVYIKRVVGLGGDEVEIEGGILYINGEEQYSRFIRGNRINWNDTKVKVPYDRVFVMGDNRNDSEDSLNFGPLTGDRIIGVLRYILWPTDRWGKVKRLDELEAAAEAEAEE